MVDAEIQWRVWQSGEQERQGGGWMGQVIEAGKGQDRVGYWVWRGPGCEAEDKLRVRWREGQVETKSNDMMERERGGGGGSESRTE